MSRSALLLAWLTIPVSAVMSVQAASSPASAPKASDDLWKAAIQTALDKGKSEAIPGTPLVSYALQDFTGDPKAAHMLHAITVNISLDPEYKERKAQFYFGDRRASKSGGWIRIEWVLRTDSQGMLTEVIHNTYTTQPGKGEADEQKKAEKTDLSDPKTKARFDNELKYWAKRKP